MNSECDMFLIHIAAESRFCRHGSVVFSSPVYFPDSWHRAVHVGTHGSQIQWLAKKKKKKEKKNPPQRKEVTHGDVWLVSVWDFFFTQTTCDKWGITHYSRCSVFREKYMHAKNREAHLNHFKTMSFRIGYTFSLYIHTDLHFKLSRICTISSSYI